MFSSKKFISMQKVTGSSDVKHIECINPKKDKWKVRWAIKATENGAAEYMEEDFDHKPTVDEIKGIIIGWYNSNIDTEIVSGFVWNGTSVWLSTENQFNYKTAFDAAVMSGGATLPVKFKFGDDDTPVYHEFKTIEELSDFYYKAIAFVQSVLQKGWDEKDLLNFKVYEVEEVSD